MLLEVDARGGVVIERVPHRDGHAGVRNRGARWLGARKSDQEAAVLAACGPRSLVGGWKGFPDGVDLIAASPSQPL